MQSRVEVLRCKNSCGNLILKSYEGEQKRLVKVPESTAKPGHVAENARISISCLALSQTSNMQKPRSSLRAQSTLVLQNCSADYSLFQNDFVLLAGRRGSEKT